MDLSPPPTEGVANGLEQSRLRGPFSFDVNDTGGRGRAIFAALAPALERLLGLTELNGVHRRAADGDPTLSFLDRVIADLGVQCHVRDADLDRIPARGPLVVVANHPFGAIEGVLLGHILRRRRPDVKVMANYLLGSIPELRDLLLFVDPFGKKHSAGANLRPMRQAIRWVESGGALAVFPAGAVAHWHRKQGCVTDPPWSSTVARIIRKTRASVLPVFFDGRNSLLFQLLGTIHPLLRTGMLPREVLNKRRTTIETRIGSVIAGRKVAAISSDEEATAYVRRRTLILGHRAAPEPQANHSQNAAVPIAMEPICAAILPELLTAEIAALPAGQRLAGQDDLAVYQAEAAQIPSVLREIGRLREITYRATGEGTGKSIDLDRFDATYTHLFVWNHAAREVVGAYRLAPTDRVLAREGIAGLYTATLFSYRPEFMDRMGPAIELGRSFVRGEYQRSYAPLLLLWKGIGQFIVQNPRYGTLFGPVSISNDYQTVSKQMMVQFLDARHRADELANLVRPRHPFRTGGIAGKSRGVTTAALKASDDLDDLVAEVERDGKGIPVLLRQYLKLGARFLAYNVDPDFSDALDGLMVIDLTGTERKLLDRYLGSEGAARFLAYHTPHTSFPRLARETTRNAL